MEQHTNLAIIAGGGPAPGINSVIGAATIRARLEGCQVLGIRDGFEWLMQGDITHVTPLTIEGVSRIHFRGGSHIGIARANPSKNPQHLENVVLSLLRLNVSQLITIGGDDTAFSAMKLEAHAGGRIRVVHVPKTIDNDLDLPAHIDTFGFQTARHFGVDIVKNLMVDAKTTARWYFVVAMGRTAGHLSLGISKAAGATLALIPEEFTPPLKLKQVVDTLAGAIIKRMSYGRRDGVAVIGEGVVLHIREEDLVLLPDRYVALDDALCLVRLASMLEGYRKPYRVRAQRSTSFADLRDTPAVLIGAFDNPWTLRTADQLRFTFRKDSVQDTGMVHDSQHPENSGWKLVKYWPNWDVPVDYAIVTRMGDTTTGRPVIIAAGLTQYGTNGAGEFLSNQDYFSEAARQLPKDWQKKNLQIVLSVPVVNRISGRPRVLATHVW